MPAWLILMLANVLPIVLGELGKLILSAAASAKPLIEKAQADGTLPNGTERHKWVSTQLLPLVQASAGGIISPLVQAGVDIGVKLGYNQLSWGGKQIAVPKSSIPPVVTAIAIAFMLSSCALLPAKKAIPVTYPKTTLSTAETSEGAVDTIIVQDKAISLEEFRSRVTRLESEGGWAVKIPPYLNSLPPSGGEGIYVVTLERKRPQ